MSFKIHGSADFHGQVPKSWQRDHDAWVEEQAVDHKNGVGKDRGVVPKGPGGDGRVISSGKESTFRRKEA